MRGMAQTSWSGAFPWTYRPGDFTYLHGKQGPVVSCYIEKLINLLKNDLSGTSWEV